jgi:septal ring factor EnvC (AmiA/AmiB activator)
MVSEGEALINSLREEMEKNSQLREQLSAKEQVIATMERDRRDLERDLARCNQENRNTLQLMSNLQDSHKEQVGRALGMLCGNDRPRPLDVCVHRR